MSKLDKSIKNARVAFVFYFVTLVVSFISRKVFIETLGTELIGLSSTMQNILGFLNLAELGVYMAVTYALYKPLVDKNYDEINKIISLFGYLYRIIGLFILIVGIIVSFFLPVFFEKTALHWTVLFGSYYTFLSVTLFSYFNNYRQILLASDQKGYTVTRVNNYLNIAKVILQIICLKYITPNYFVWLGFEFLFGIITRFRTNMLVKRDYPWLQPNLKNGKLLFKEYPQILKNVKNLFAHKIAEFALFQTDQILIYIFTSLTVVTYYGNYMMIIKRVASLITSTLGANLAAVGHVVAEGNLQKTHKLFIEFNALFFFIGGVFVYCLYYLTEPFIALWLGPEFILSQTVFILILMAAYILIIRQSVKFFINGFGLYRDIWAAWTEAGVNLLVSIIGGYYWGLPGILLGGVTSTFLIVVIWKPYFLFRSGFNVSALKYWKDVAIYIALLVLSCVILFPLHQYLPVATSYFTWILNAAVIASVFVLIYGGSMYFFAPGLKDICLRLLSKWKKKR